MDRLTFSLRPVPPFRLDLTAWVLRRRADNLVDRWDGAAYRRVLAIRAKPTEVMVTQTAPSDEPRIAVTVTGVRLAPDARSIAIAALERLLGIRCDMSEFYRFSARDQRLSALARDWRGFKPPRFPSVFEEGLALPTLKEMLDRLRFIEIQCAE